MSQGVAVVGLDLSATSCGVAWATGCTTITHPATPGASLSDWAYRLQSLADRLMEQIQLLKPRLIIVEDPIVPRKIHKTSNFHERAGLYWLVICALKGEGYQVHGIRPSAAKTLLSGNGNANKRQQVDNAKLFFKGHFIRKDDEADALACCAVGHEWIGLPIGDIPQEHRELTTPPPWATDEDRKQHERRLRRRASQKKRLKASEKIGA